MKYAQDSYIFSTMLSEHNEVQLNTWCSLSLAFSAWADQRLIQHGRVGALAARRSLKTVCTRRANRKEAGFALLKSDQIV